MKTYKALFTADLHMSNMLPMSRVVNNGITDRLKDQIKVIKRMYKAAMKYDVDDIFVIGDVFDRALVDAVTLTQTVRIISSTPKPLKIIAGNHDAASSKGGRYTVEALGAMRNKMVELLHGEYAPREWLRFVAIPYLPIEETRIEIDRYASPGDRTDVLLFHNSVLGCDHLEWTCDDGLEPDEMLRDYDYAIGGHFHQHQKFGPKNRGMYCGAPMHHNFGDRGRKAGFWIMEFEPGKRTKKYIPSGAPKFHIATKGKIPKHKSGDYIRYEVKCTNAEWVYAKTEAEDAVSGLDANVHVKQKPVYHHKKRLVVDSKQIASVPAAIDEYVNSKDVVTDGLDVDKLSDIGKRIYAEVVAKNGII